MHISNVSHNHQWRKSNLIPTTLLPQRLGLEVITETLSDFYRPTMKFRRHSKQHIRGAAP